MNIWIEVKARYNKIMENGACKQVTEAYLIDAMSCTEAEARVIEALAPAGDLSVVSAAKTKIAEVFDLCGEKYYKIKDNKITLDTNTGEERKTPEYVIVPADNLPEALRNYSYKMATKYGLTDTNIESVCETKYIDVFFYTPINN